MSPALVKIDMAKLNAWRAKGAQPTLTVLQLIEKAPLTATPQPTPGETDVSPTVPAA